MAVPFLSWGTTPHRSDTVNTLLKRIAGSAAGGGGSGSGQAGIVGTDPNPNGIYTAEPGTTYTDRLLHTNWMKETGSGDTGWVQYV